MFLAAAVEEDAATATSGLGAGEVALVDASSYLSVELDGTTAAPAEFLIVQGNLNQVDTLGGNPLHGGYAESIKSKVIKKNYVNAMWKVVGTAASANPVVKLGLPAVSGFAATDHPQIRIDLKGSEVLRSLNRNEYFIADATGCGASGDGTLTGLEVLTAWKDAINGDPIMSKFVSATVTEAATADTTDAANLLPAQEAHLSITVNYSATTFAADSFDTRDAYNTEPLTLTVSAIDDDGDACGSSVIEAGVDVYTDITDNTTDVIEAPLLTATGVSAVRTAPTVTGECVLRDLIQDGRYRQDGGFSQGNKDSNRFREIEGGAKLVEAVDVDALYTIYNIQHSVPRFNNPTGVFDNDQYIVSIAVLNTDTTEVAALDEIIAQITVATGVAVTTPLVD